MKSFLALAIVVARDIPADQLQAPLYLIATADEESSMSGPDPASVIRPWLSEVRHNPIRGGSAAAVQAADALGEPWPDNALQ